jgi:hypothetical protein
MRLLTNIPITLLLLIASSLMNPTRAIAQIELTLPEAPLVVHVEKVRKTDFLYLGSQAFLGAGTMMDMKSTVDGLNHPTVASRQNGMFLTNYYARETGWAGVFGQKNTNGVVAANVLLSTGFDLLDRRLYRRGGKWRIVAITLNFAKGLDNGMSAFHNIGVNKDIDKHVRLQTGYNGRIIWSH